MLMLYYVYKNYLTYIWIKFTVFLRENCAEQGANKAVFDALFVLSFAQDVSWNIFFLSRLLAVLTVFPGVILA